MTALATLAEARQHRVPLPPRTDEIHIGPFLWKRYAEHERKVLAFKSKRELEDCAVPIINQEAGR